MPGLAKINNPTYDSVKVLIAPLDWGLGHATRCFPIIKELLNQRCEVIIAASGAQRALLQEEFTSLTFVELPGYRITYGKNRAITIARLVCSIPKILIRIKQERAWLRRFAREEGLDLVISDNRYGLAVPGVFCVFITHQLRIRTPFGRWADDWLQRMNYRLIRHFSRCWVPDAVGADALAGELSNPVLRPAIPTRYIGWLSRLAPRVDSSGADVLVLLSGVEPQRSLLEKKILAQAAGLTYSIILVRGLPEGGPVLNNGSITVYDHLPAAELARVMAGARVVVARSGYSTVMDLARMNKRAVLVPTPGQTEQEYLGLYLAARGHAACMLQNEFLLGDALSLAPSEPSWPVDGRSARLAEEIASVLVQSRPSALG